uniref:Uncharacterized protein n=1 Tax=Cucumis sativus TaxID=3659 RepID=A0A0A0K8Z3_CUCSA
MGNVTKPSSSRRLSPSRLGLSSHAVVAVQSSLLLSLRRSSPIVSTSQKSPIVARAWLSLTIALLCCRWLRYLVVYNSSSRTDQSDYFLKVNNFVSTLL